MEVKADGGAMAPEGTVFENRGFMTDITADDGQPELTPEQADAVMAGAGAGEMPVAPEVTPEAAPAAKVRIGSREFTNTEEAWAYAQELEQEKIAADAFRQGVETASQAREGNLPPVPREPEQIDPLFYTDPAAYFRKREDEIAAQVTAKVNQGLTMKEKNAETWTKFYSDYPDLLKAQPLVQLNLNAEWENLKHVETGKALKIIAEKARAMKREMLTDELPAQALPRVPQGASAGRGIGVTPTEAKEQDLNLIQQFRNMRKNRTSRMRR